MERKEKELLSFPIGSADLEGLMQIGIESVKFTFTEDGIDIEIEGPNECEVELGQEALTLSYEMEDE